MATQNGISCDGGFKEQAKELLRSDEYERLNIAVKNFSKTRSLEVFCSNLIKIVNSPSKVTVLAEVRRRLPKNQRNKFTRYCNELLKSGALRERRDLEKKREGESKVERMRENRVPKFPCSPAKRTKKDDEKTLNSKREKKVSQGSKKSVQYCEKEVTSANTRDRTFGRGKKQSSTDFCANKIVLLKRDSLTQGFGFRVRGGNSREPSTVAEVAKGSLADRQGLKKGDRIIRVNDKRCGRGGINGAQLIQVIKAAKGIQMRISSSEFICKDDYKVEDVAKLKDRGGNKAEEKGISTVNVFPGEDGWLGCCIRGGADYACDVHVISVDAGSPAERAGVKAGDIIVEINGTSTKKLTHVQVVRLVVTSRSCVRFCLKPGVKQMRRSSICQRVVLRPTPLRTQNVRSNEGTPPRSPSFRQPHLPGYPHSHRIEAANSPSHIPLNSLTLDCLPPPPYTPEVPSRHRVLAKGKEGPGTPRHKLQDTTYIIEPQVTQRSQTTQEQLGPQASHVSEGPQSTHFHQEPSHCGLEQQDMATLQDEIQCGLYEQQSQHNLNLGVVMEIVDDGEALISISDGKGSLNGNVAHLFEDGGTLEQDNVPCSSIIQQEKAMLLQEDTCIDSSSSSSSSQSPAHVNGGESFLFQIRHFNKAKLKKLEDPLQTSPCEEPHSVACGSSHTPDAIQTSVDDCRLSVLASHSPSPVNNRESFLTQVRQFNKAKLRNLSQSPVSSVSGGHDQLPGKPSENYCTPEGPKSEQHKDSGPESIDAGSLLTVLTQVMKNRARVMHDTLSSADEFDSDSSFDDSDDEWEL